MQISWRRNPKTPDGWFKRTAISLLVALGGFVVTFPLSFLLFALHYRDASPNDPQNLIEALTAGVVTGLVLAAVLFAASMTLFLLLVSLRGRPAAQ
jgi:uncharacterized BrkB/YihY/UPF0761 family membrane protein